jgi:hypothetical protein
VSNTSDLKRKIEDSLHLTIAIIDEHFGSIEEIREKRIDGEEANYLLSLKTKSYEVILKKLLDINLKESQKMLAPIDK